MPTLESFDGTELHYQDLGEGRPVVLLHGWGASHAFWDRQMGHFADRYRMIGMDLRGHGESEAPADGYTYEDHGRDVNALLRSLDLEEVTLLGWSFGGGVSIHVAATRGDRLAQLVLVAPAAPKMIADEEFPHGVDEAVAHQFLDRERTERETFRRWIFEHAVYRNLGEETMNWMVSEGLKTPSWAGAACMRTMIEADLTPRLAELEVPTLLLQGQREEFFEVEGIRYLERRIADARLHLFSASGHTPHLEETDAFNRVLGEFLREG